MEQFLSTSIGESDELTESYLVGSRLVKFLSVVLPTHPEYFSVDARLAALRHRSQEQLIELLQYMEELSLLIDEMQYNKYILQDLTPEQKTYLTEVQKNNSQDISQDISQDMSDKENHAETKESEKLDQKVAAVEAGESVEQDDWSEQYRRHVASVLAAQPPPPPPPPRDSKQAASQYSQPVEAEETSSEPESDPSWIALISDDSSRPDESKKTSWDSSSFSARPSRSRIDILDSNNNNHTSTTNHQPTPTSPGGIPKLRQPRSAPTRRARVPGYSRKVAHFQESPTFFDHNAEPSLSQNNEDLKLRIEERWEQAQRRERNQRQFQRTQLRGHYGGNYYEDSSSAYGHGQQQQQQELGLVLNREDTSLDTSYTSNRRLLEQFRGCIKCLLD
jgi:hypothetical protein